MFNLNQLNFLPEKNRRFISLYKAFKIATIFLIILAIFFVKHLLSAETTTAEKYFQQGVIQTASNIAGRADFIISDLKTLSADLTFRYPSLPESNVMDFLIKNSTRPGYHRLIFAYPDGKALRAQRGKILSTVDWTQEARFQTAMNGEAAFLGTETNSQTTSRYVNKYGVPVYNKDGKVVGVLGALYDSGAFIRILSYGNYGEHGTVYIINSAGDFMLKPARDKSKTTNFFDNNYKYIKTTREDVQKLLAEKDKGVFNFKYKNQKYAASFANVGGVDCYIIAIIPINDLMLNINKLLISIIAVIAIISSCMLALLYCSHRLFKEHEKIIYNTAFVDKITQKGNKNKFKLDAKTLLNINSDANYAMISVDIKRFKIINELYGEERANEILKVFSKMIQDSLPKDSVYARDYNATFAVLYKYDKENFIVKYFIEKLMDEIEIYNESQMQQTVTNSGIMVSTKLQLLFGVYLIDDKELSIDQMYEKAIIAKKQIKEDTLKAYSFYDNSLKIKLLQRRVIEDEMYSALASGQFNMYLQPKFGLQSGNIAGAEALVRWIHPSKGLIPPIDFIPLFEQNGFVIELDKCIWRQACEFIAKRKKEGLTLFPISINVSRLHLHNDAFINELLSLTSQYEVEPKYLELELTESASYEDEKRFKTIIKRLKELNFTIAMDDFGTGYSSLSILKDLPFDVLKLDRGFVKDATNNLKAEIVIKTMIDMANKLNMTTVAEGIETEDQADLLRGMGCNIAQGFLYGKPMNLTQFEEFCELNREEHHDIVI